MAKKHRPPPKIAYPTGLPLWSRERNYEILAAHMRQRAEELWHRQDSDGDPVIPDVDELASEIADYADMIDTLMNHGSRSFYVLGCKCTWCREANRQAETRRRTGGHARRVTFVKSILEDEL